MEEDLYYESDRLFNKQYCRECGTKDTYVRIYFHEKKMHSRYLCRNCAEYDYIPKGYKLLTVGLKFGEQAKKE